GLTAADKMSTRRSAFKLISNCELSLPPPAFGSPKIGLFYRRIRAATRAPLQMLHNSRYRLSEEEPFGEIPIYPSRGESGAFAVKQPRRSCGSRVPSLLALAGGGRRPLRPVRSRAGKFAKPRSGDPPWRTG